VRRGTTAAGNARQTAIGTHVRTDGRSRRYRPARVHRLWVRTLCVVLGV